MTVALGFFDGVHLGHRAVLDGADVALTFRDHPAAVLRPQTDVPLLMSEEERLAALRTCVRRVEVLDFTPALAAESAGDFLVRLRVLFPEGFSLRLGFDATFGRGGAGNAAFLRAHGVTVTSVPPVLCEGAPVSSTRIRQALVAGEAETAATLLGRPYAFTGTVRRGKGLGRTLGFPTVNVFPGRPLPIRGGVWTVDTPYGRGVANWGTAPTFGAAAWQEPVFEIHLQREPPSVADGMRLETKLLRFLRPERAFADADALRTALADDCRRAFGSGEEAPGCTDERI